MARLQHDAPKLDDPHIMVNLAKAVALPGNAHTRLYLVRARTAVRQYPVQVWWFQEEVARAARHAGILALARLRSDCDRGPFRDRRTCAGCGDVRRQPVMDGRT